MPASSDVSKPTRVGVALRRKGRQHLARRSGRQLAGAASGFDVLRETDGLGMVHGTVGQAESSSVCLCIIFDHVGKSTTGWKCLGSGESPGLQNRRSSLTGDG